jgi:Ni/Co efflux regulator RcnB
VFYQGRSFSSFRAAPFSYPGGWGYRRWAAGQFLPGLFLTQGYFIYNWNAYGLGPPPPGLQWVRYGPDALLVNVYTGQVVDTVYGVFWW